MFEWREEYSMSIESMDNQHKQLLKIADQIMLLLADVKEIDVYDDIMAHIESLINYTLTHFKDEEALMARFAYPELAQHQREHQEIIDKLKAIDLESLDRNQEDFLKDLIRFIGKWILSHVMSSDKGYKHYFDDKNIEIL